MQTAPISGLQSTQQMQATSGEFLLQIMKAAKADPNGPFGKWVASHEKELKALFSQYLSGNQSVSFTAAQFPQAYSSDQISPEVQEHANAYLNEPAIQSSARMAPSYTDGSDDSAQTSSESSNMIVDDPYGGDSGDGGGDSWNVGSDGSDDGSNVSAGGSDDGSNVSTDDPGNLGNDLPTGGSSDEGSSSGPVQTSGGGDPTESSTSSTLDEAPAPPPIVLQGDGFTSTAEFQRLADAKAKVDELEQKLRNDPNNPQLALALTDAKMALQLEMQSATEDAQIAGQHAMDSLKAAILH
ncbi:MAG TPA: hypothetical protein VKE70_34335 [Candidatus Solibacter sp.]|nr:hypothetical protein [Candidatus Solibacter sp.]